MKFRINPAKLSFWIIIIHRLVAEKMCGSDQICLVRFLLVGVECVD